MVPTPISARAVSPCAVAVSFGRVSILERKSLTIESVGQIAARLRIPIHRVLYVVRSRGIRPAVRVGSADGYDAEAVTRIEHEIARIAEARDTERPGGGAAS
jgi:hypothetical protein